MSLPTQVTLSATARHGYMPALTAPQKPYTELAETLRASWRALQRALRCSSSALAISCFARLRAARMWRRIAGSTPGHERVNVYAFDSDARCVSYSTPGTSAKGPTTSVDMHMFFASMMEG
jgi:hypothetical protein